MITGWTKEDIEAVMLQLQAQGLPFQNYKLTMRDGHPVLLGQGATACIFEVQSQSRMWNKTRYALKVIGFCDGYAEDEEFESINRAQQKMGMMSNVVYITQWTQVRVWIRGDHEVEKASACNLS
jgi:hypothetical protein